VTGPAGPGDGSSSQARFDVQPGVVLIGVGNEFRRDDGVGPQVLAMLRDAVPESVRLVGTDGDPARLIEAWTGAEVAVVVDAVSGEPAEPGRTHRLVLERPEADGGAGSGADDGSVRAVSSHGLGLGEAIGLARVLDRMPGRLIIHAVEATDFDFGVGLSPAVAAAADGLAAAVLADIAAAVS
jgi:hydrogenase maturation protease